MKLTLNEEVLKNHKQKYANSCVPMAIELVLKLMGKMDIDDYSLQDEKGDKSRGGIDYNLKIKNGVEISLDFDILRGPTFPLEQLFEKITQELDEGRFVNCACRDKVWQNFHAYVIYGYQDDEFLAISTDLNLPEVYFIDNMKSRLKDNKGSDLLTFKRI